VESAFIRVIKIVVKDKKIYGFAYQSVGRLQETHRKPDAPLFEWIK
jgi:hypothetical protein